MSLASLTAALERTPLLALALLLLAGLLAGQLAAHLKMPQVLGYLLVGVLLSPHNAPVFSLATQSALQPLSDVAISLIVFTIGAFLDPRRLRRLGTSALIIVLTQAALIFLLVAAAVFLLAPAAPGAACLLGIIAVAAATPTTFAVVRECASQGPLTETLLVVVVLNDVLALVAFRFLAAGPEGGKTLLLILGSLALGALIGWLLGVLARRIAQAGALLGITLAGLLLVLGVAERFGLSALLGCLAMGMVTAPGSAGKDVPHSWKASVQEAVRPLETLAYALFFTLAGTQLDLSALASEGATGLAYVLMRGVGKYLGGMVGSRLVGAPSPVQQHLGVALLPQAAIAVALVAQAAVRFPSAAPRMTAIVLTGVLIFQIGGVLALRRALERAGESPPIGGDAAA